MFLNTIKTVFGSNDTIAVLIIFVITTITLRFFYLRNHRERIVFYKEFLTILGVIYMFLLFELVTNVELNHGSTYNLMPFSEILRYKLGSRLFWFNVVGNVAVFTVFGLFVSGYIKPKNILPIFWTSIIVSTTIEFVQLHIGRCFDIDDIILNVLGGIIGYLLYVALVAIKRHLPGIFRKDGLYNIICFIIIALIVFYILRFVGVLNI